MKLHNISFKYFSGSESLIVCLFVLHRRVLNGFAWTCRWHMKTSHVRMVRNKSTLLMSSVVWQGYRWGHLQLQINCTGHTFSMLTLVFLAFILHSQFYGVGDGVEGNWGVKSQVGLKFSATQSKLLGCWAGFMFSVLWNCVQALVRKRWHLKCRYLGILIHSALMSYKGRFSPLQPLLPPLLPVWPRSSAHAWSWTDGERWRRGSHASSSRAVSHRNGSQWGGSTTEVWASLKRSSERFINDHHHIQLSVVLTLCKDTTVILRLIITKKKTTKNAAYRASTAPH